MISNRREKGCEQKHTVSTRQNKFTLAKMKDSLKNMFLLDGKVTLVAVISEKIGGNGFH